MVQPLRWNRCRIEPFTLRPGGRKVKGNHRLVHPLGETDNPGLHLPVPSPWQAMFFMPDAFFAGHVFEPFYYMSYTAEVLPFPVNSIPIQAI